MSEMGERTVSSSLPVAMSRPSEDQAALHTASVCPCRTLEFVLAVSHTWTVPSSLVVARTCPAGDHTTPLGCALGIRVATSLPVWAFNRKTCTSYRDEAIRCPSGDQATPRT